MCCRKSNKLSIITPKDAKKQGDYLKLAGIIYEEEKGELSIGQRVNTMASLHLLTLSAIPRSFG